MNANEVTLNVSAPHALTRARKLGIGIMLVFAVKGLITTGLIVATALAGFGLL